MPANPEEIAQASTASLRAVRELAAVVLVLVEAVVDVLGHQKVQAAPATTGWRYRNSYEFGDEDEQR